MTGQEPSDVLFIGNATTLIRHDGFTLLTDPNFLHRGQRAHLGYGLTSRRRTEPALNVGDLPPLDAIVLSHMHGDHWDRIARHGLDKRVPVITTRHLRRQGFTRAVGLRTWGEHRLHKNGRTLTVTSLPARHAPGPARYLLPPVMGSMLDFTRPDGQVDLRLHISGDTLLDPILCEIPVRFPGIDVGLVHLGGTKLLGLLVTMDAAQGVRWVRLIAPRVAVPVHYDDYTVFSSPLSAFRRAVARAGLSDRVRYAERGQAFPLPARTVPAAHAPRP
ncbi:MBL fold metallo-hydrolase [Sphaerisporangium sp. B11E5]|uniref:MBL fold metallo-hydrolase n=1 Tax=Sphaerisporangium sp. B11E5 TaxID=3153563 RepID=UPI00325DABD0